MDTQDWITLGVAGASAIWVWYKTVYYPARVKQQEAQEAFDRERVAQSYAQVIKINEKFVNAFIRIIEDQLAEINSALKELADLVSVVETLRLNIVRIEEIHSDIDIELHTIKSLLHYEQDKKDFDSVDNQN